MHRPIALSLLCCLLVAGSLAAQTREQKVRGDKAKVEAAGFWIYNDLAQGFAEAKKSGKPLLVVMRCIPCEHCVKLDDDLVEQDQRLRPLLEKFVRVRVVSANGLDLSLFQFDTDQSFAVFMFNADGTIYGRFGTRSDQTHWSDDVSIEGLAKALEGALVLHADFPKNKATLAAKKGAPPEFAVPESFPTLKGKYGAQLNYEGNVVQSCIHCHQIGDAQRQHHRNQTGKIPDEVLFPYPHPKAIGLILDPQQRATVLRVEPGSLAAQAGLRGGRDPDAERPAAAFHRRRAVGAAPRAFRRRRGHCGGRPQWRHDRGHAQASRRMAAAGRHRLAGFELATAADGLGRALPEGSAGRVAG